MAFLVRFACAPAIAAVSPFKLNTFIASFVMRSNRWDAGQELMDVAHPEGWKELADASDRVRANRDAIAKCRAAATKALRRLEPNVRSRNFYASRGRAEVRVYRHETIPLNTIDMTKLVGSNEE
jgi:hypothetical protein